MNIGGSINLMKRLASHSDAGAGSLIIHDTRTMVAEEMGTQVLKTIRPENETSILHRMIEEPRTREMPIRGNVSNIRQMQDELPLAIPHAPIPRANVHKAQPKHQPHPAVEHDMTSFFATVSPEPQRATVSTARRAVEDTKIIVRESVDDILKNTMLAEKSTLSRRLSSAEVEKIKLQKELSAHLAKPLSVPGLNAEQQEILKGSNMFEEITRQINEKIQGFKTREHRLEKIDKLLGPEESLATEKGQKGVIAYVSGQDKLRRAKTSFEKDRKAFLEPALRHAITTEIQERSIETRRILDDISIQDQTINWYKKQIAKIDEKINKLKISELE